MSSGGKPPRGSKRSGAPVSRGRKPKRSRVPVDRRLTEDSLGEDPVGEEWPKMESKMESKMAEDGVSGVVGGTERKGDPGCNPSIEPRVHEFDEQSEGSRTITEDERYMLKARIRALEREYEQASKLNREEVRKLKRELLTSKEACEDVKEKLQREINRSKYEQQEQYEGTPLEQEDQLRQLSQDVFISKYKSAENRVQELNELVKNLEARIEKITERYEAKINMMKNDKDNSIKTVSEKTAENAQLLEDKQKQLEEIVRLKTEHRRAIQTERQQTMMYKISREVRNEDDIKEKNAEIEELQNENRRLLAKLEELQKANPTDKSANESNSVICADESELEKEAELARSKARETILEQLVKERNECVKELEANFAKASKDNEELVRDLKEQVIQLSRELTERNTRSEMAMLELFRTNHQQFTDLVDGDVENQKIISDLKTEKTEIGNKLEDLEEKMNIERALKDSLEVEISKLCEQSINQAADLEKALATIEQLKLEKAKNDKEIEQTRDNMIKVKEWTLEKIEFWKNREAEHEKQRAINVSLQEENSKLKIQSNGQADELQKALATIEQLKLEKAENEKIISDLKTDKTKLGDKLEDLEKTLKSEQENNTKLKTEMSDLQVQSKNQADELQKAKDTIAKLQQSAANAQLEKAEHEKQRAIIVSLQEENSKLKVQSNGQAEELQKQSAINVSLQEENSTLKVQSNGHAEELQKQHASIFRLQAQTAGILLQFNGQIEELQKQRAINVSLQEEKSNLLAQLNGRADELQKALATTEQLQDENTTLHTRLVEAQKGKDDVSEVNSSLRGERSIGGGQQKSQANDSAANAQLREENAKLQEENAKLRGEINELLTGIKQFEETS